MLAKGTSTLVYLVILKLKKLINTNSKEI